MRRGRQLWQRGFRTWSGSLRPSRGRDVFGAGSRIGGLRPGRNRREVLYLYEMINLNRASPGLIGLLGLFLEDGFEAVIACPPPDFPEGTARCAVGRVGPDTMDVPKVPSQFHRHEGPRGAANPHRRWKPTPDSNPGPVREVLYQLRLHQRAQDLAAYIRSRRAATWLRRAQAPRPHPRGGLPAGCPRPPRSPHCSGRCGSIAHHQYIPGVTKCTMTAQGVLALATAKPGCVRTRLPSPELPATPTAGTASAQTQAVARMSLFTWSPSSAGHDVQSSSSAERAHPRHPPKPGA